MHQKTAFKIIGPPGAGKGTLANAISAVHPHTKFLSTGDIMRRIRTAETEIGRTVKSFVDAGLMVPDDLTVEVVEHHLVSMEHHPDRLFLDGFPRTSGQAEPAIRILTGLGYTRIVLVHIETSLRVCVRRLTSRGRSDDDIEVIERRIKEYNKKTLPLIKYLRRRSGITYLKIDGTDIRNNPRKYVRQVFGE